MAVVALACGGGRRHPTGIPSWRADVLFDALPAVAAERGYAVDRPHGDALAVGIPGLGTLRYARDPDALSDDVELVATVDGGRTLTRAEVRERRETLWRLSDELLGEAYPPHSEPEIYEFP